MTSRTTIIESNRNIAYSQYQEAETYVGTDSDAKYGNQSNSKWQTYIPDGLQVNVGDSINLEASMINSIGGGDEVMEFTGDSGTKYVGRDTLDDRAMEIEFNYYITNRYQFNFNYPKLGTNINYFVNSFDYGGPACNSYGVPDPQTGNQQLAAFAAWEAGYPYQCLEGFSTDVTKIPRTYTIAPASLSPSFQKPPIPLYNPSNKRMYIGHAGFRGPYYEGQDFRTDVQDNFWDFYTDSVRVNVPEGFSTPSSVAETLTSQLHAREGPASQWENSTVPPKTFGIDSNGIITGQVLPAITDVTYKTFPTSTGRLFYSRELGQWHSAFQGEKSGGNFVNQGTGFRPYEGRFEFYKYLMTTRPYYYRGMTNSFCLIQSQPANSSTDLSGGQYDQYFCHSGGIPAGGPIFTVKRDKPGGEITYEVGNFGNRPILLDKLPEKQGSITYTILGAGGPTTNPQAACLDLSSGNIISTNVFWGNNVSTVLPYFRDNQDVGPEAGAQDLNSETVRRNITAPFYFGMIDDKMTDSLHREIFQLAPYAFFNGHEPADRIGNGANDCYFNNTVTDDTGTQHTNRPTMYGNNNGNQHAHKIFTYQPLNNVYTAEVAMANNLPGAGNLFPHNPDSLFMTAHPTGDLEKLKEYWAQIPQLNNHNIGIVPVFYKDGPTATANAGTNAFDVPFVGFIFKENEDPRINYPLPIQGEFCWHDPSLYNTQCAIIATTQKKSIGLYPQPDASQPDQTRPEAYMPFCFAGSADSLIKFDDGFSKFTISQLHTPTKTGNGPYQNPTEPTNETPQQDVMTINEQEAHFGTAGVGGPVAYKDQIAVAFPQPVISAQSGVGINRLAVMTNKGETINREEAVYLGYYNSIYYKGCLLDKLGFELEQLLPYYGQPQNEFNRGNYNKYLGSDDRLSIYDKYVNMAKPLTTNAYISSAEQIALAQMSAVLRSSSGSTTDIVVPSASIGTPVFKQARTNAESDILLATNLPKKLSYPYLVVYSDIIRNASYYGGPNGHEKLNAIAYITRNYAEGDFFYSFTTNWNYTADTDYVITSITTDIRLPDGRAAPIDGNSSVIYKIQKPQIMPVPPMLPPPKKEKREQDKDA